MIEVTESPIDLDEAQPRISREGVGSLVVHIGIVKPVIKNKKLLALPAAQ